MSPTHPSSCLKIGAGDLRYEALARWESLPEGWSFVEVAGVATDSQDRVYVFNRGEHPLIIFDRDGQFLGSWGEGQFQRPHGIFIGPDDTVYCTDDLDHTVRKFNLDGLLLLTLGSSGQASATGIVGIDYRTIRRGGPPFNRPTNLALAADGTMYVTDGYGNARVHCFAPDGRRLSSWGEPGSGPGQFNLPHGIAVDRVGRVYVADRENSRIQVFTAEGKFVTQWTDVLRPMQIFIDRRDRAFVVELGWQAGLFPWQTAWGADLSPAPPSALGHPRSGEGAGGGVLTEQPGARLSVFDLEGRLLASWASEGDPCAPGNFFAPHSIWIDSRGDLYIGEVVWSAGGNRGLVPSSCHAVQKFVFVKESLGDE
jgi:DNA-binding beta-propeller fold protein YncE